MLELLQSFDDYMNALTVGDIVVQMIAVVLLLPVLTLIHEFGHASR